MWAGLKEKGWARARTRAGLAVKLCSSMPRVSPPALQHPLLAHSGGIGYGYLRLEAMDPVDEVGDLAGDSVLGRQGEPCKQTSAH
ncbi:hypothetical protein JZ751_015690 [Albula glossodonta]|uniref:Uncharacterized protein n=1 Tax=Albula glossodonta TaxID=121402 RepID=A0A8T2NZI3_9TELE|nr:hypothetical protein JZ751_005429 [Albula glossodonta]KAG9342818.1 hypothetical protein JZ751_015690 [Albula glossodonta]